jgi:hypothetical protein
MREQLLHFAMLFGFGLLAGSFKTIIFVAVGSGSAQALCRAAARWTNNLTTNSQILLVSGKACTLSCLQHRLAHTSAASCAMSATG